MTKINLIISEFNCLHCGKKVTLKDTTGNTEYKINHCFDCIVELYKYPKVNTDD